MLGEPEQTWDPWSYLDRSHPDWRVVRTDLLPEPIQGCVDFKRRIVWLARGLSRVAELCTLAYELAQLEQGPTPQDPCLARARQQAALDRAATWLVSAHAMVQAFQTARSIPEAATTLGVDTPTLRARLRCLTDDEQDAVMSAVLESAEAAA
jgi:hypothetical protein